MNNLTSVSSKLNVNIDTVVAWLINQLTKLNN
jgi:hypothetical protein